VKELRGRLGRATGTAGRADLSPLAGTFLRGLSLGALVGAAIAGSAMWRRARDRQGEGKSDGRPWQGGAEEPRER
jgi:hypothetical protein